MTADATLRRTRRVLSSMKPINSGSRASAVVFIALALAACGNEAAPTAGAPSATPTASTTVPRDPNLIPSTPAPQAFVDRANEVARAVRAAGIPKLPEGIILHSSRTPGLGFDTGEQKMAWTAGYVVIAPGVRLGSGGRSRLHFANGSSVPVTVLGPRAALTNALKPTTPSNCRNIPRALCTLTITSASATTAEAITSSGPTTVPAWSFTAKGMSTRIVVLAVSEDDLKPRTYPVPPPGLAPPPPGLLEAGSLTRVDGKTLTVTLHHGSCDPDLRAHVVEFDDLVVIGGTHGPVRSGFCDDALRIKPATITLTSPLADRAVITAITGIRLIPDPPR